MSTEIQPPVPSAPAPRRRGISRRAMAAITAVGLLGGGAVGGLVIASAATTSSSTSTSTAAPSGTALAPSGQPRGAFDPSKGGHVGANGVVEVLLTGDTATKVRAAATAAVPGATIERVETDAEGSPDEAHMVKSDGTHVTVKVDSNFKVTSVDTDPTHP